MFKVITNKMLACFLALNLFAIFPERGTTAEFLVLPGSNTLAMLGVLQSQDVNEFERQLLKGIDQVILSSDGGNLDAAWEIGRLIEQNGLTTTLADDTECASACAILFLHGKQRSMHEGAKLGVHLPYFNVADDQIAQVCGFLNSHLDEQLVKTEEPLEHSTSPERFELNASHILVATEAEANMVIDRLKAGGNFADAARAYSTGPSGPNGGELGWFGKGMMVLSFEAAAYQLQVGEFTNSPVKTQFGWHIILLNDVRQVIQSGQQLPEQLDSTCLTSAYQVGAIEFLRISELIQKVGGSWELLRRIVLTRSEDMYWIDFEEASQFGIVGGEPKTDE